MFTFGSGTTTNTSLFGQSTPNNQNRTGSSFLLGNSLNQPSALTSTPLSSANVFGAATPGSTTFQTPSAPIGTGTGTIHKFDPFKSTEKVNKNGILTTMNTKLCNLCAMTVYEKKSMEELRLEDYIDNRKFSSNPTPATGTTSFFGGAGLTTTTATTNPTTSFFGAPTAPTSTPAFGGALFNTQPTMTSAPTLSFAFGSSTTTAATTQAPMSFGMTTPATSTTTTSLFGNNPTPATSAFAFGSSQVPAASTATTTPAFSFGGTNTMFSTAAATSSPASFGFTAPKLTTAPTFSFTPATATTATPAMGLFSAAPATTTVAPITAAPALFQSQSSVDTKTHLQLFQTMLNIQPFNSELGFLARNIKPNIGLDRSRLRTAPDSTVNHPMTNVFSPLLTKPSVLTSTTTTTTPPSSTLVNHQLPTHAHTLPSVLLPSTTVPTGPSLGLFGKRKLADSFLDDDDDNSLMMDDGPSTTMKLPKVNASKRPRVLDMNKIRSVVLGGGGGGGNTTVIGGGSMLDTSRKAEETPSDTFIVKPSSTSSNDQVVGWKKFATYDAYLASKKPPKEFVSPPKDEKPIPVIKTKFDQDRAFRLPRLTQDDYYTKPTIDELRHRFDKHGQLLVEEFTVGREHYGSVTFQNTQINLAGLDLNRLIEIGRRQVTVYPNDDEKPKEGEEFNCPAIISLLGVYPIDRSSSQSGIEITDPDRLIEMNYGNYLREMTKKFQGKFIDYDVYTGTWRFKVDHF